MTTLALDRATEQDAIAKNLGFAKNKKESEDRIQNSEYSTHKGIEF